MKFLRIALLSILGTVPTIYGAVQSWVWVWYVGLIFVVFLWVIWRRGERLWEHSSRAAWLACLFLAWGLFQIIPVPEGILIPMSPFRASLLVNAQDLINFQEAWSSISYAPLLGIERWTLWLGAFVLAMLTARACRGQGFVKHLAAVLLVMAGMQALYGLVQALVPTTGVLGVAKYYLGDARGTFINRNHFAGMMEMIWPLGLGYLLSLSEWEGRLRLKDLINSEHFNRQLLIAIVLVVMFLAQLFSRSRAGITGIFIGFAAFVGAMTFSGAGLKRGFWIGASFCVVLLGLYCAQIGLDNVIARFLELEHGNSRAEMWRDAWSIVLQHPFGVGPGNYQILEPVFQTEGKNVPLNIHAHNDYLQLLVETGWPGFLLLISGWVYFLFTGLAGIRRRFRVEGYSTLFFMAAGAWSGLVAIGWHSFFDFNLQIPANLFYFAMLAGIVWASEGGPYLHDGLQVHDRHPLPHPA